MFIDLISNYGLFLLKTITIVISIIVVISVIVNSKKSTTTGSLEVKSINKDLDS